MSLDTNKINWGWIEQRGPSLAIGDHFSGFKSGGRVAGSGLHVVPRRLRDVFVDAYSHDHNSLHYLLKEKRVNLLSDVHFISGIKRSWSSSSDVMDNPLYVIYRGANWPSPNLKLRLAGVVQFLGEHAAHGADLGAQPYLGLVEAVEAAEAHFNKKQGVK
mmetsp:Transcript_31938/g.95634  ORF Transcript_31938/g.95634 Transcript_31938/m.95634 type:complete len:160 (-) Transcript_31938:33-512(-)